MTDRLVRNILMTRARKTWGTISPCADFTDFSESYTSDGNDMIFWFNDPCDSTRLLVFSTDDERRAGVFKHPSSM